MRIMQVSINTRVRVTSKSFVGDGEIRKTLTPDVVCRFDTEKPTDSFQTSGICAQTDAASQRLGFCLV